MIKLEVSQTQDYLVNEGKGFFYVGDTFWSALYNPSFEEWQYYLEFRKSQGYNAIGMNILFQWDGGAPEQGIYPFKLKPGGGYDFYNLNDDYFDRAQEIVKMAVDMGFVPTLGVLHTSYVKGTWCGDMYPENTMPFDLVEPYCRYVADKFSKFNPIFKIGGDNDFKTEIAMQYYMTALNTIKESAPQCLTSFMLNPAADLPEEFVQSKNLDFYSYQAGHVVQQMDNLYKMAESYYKRSVKRPIISGEFSYEGHGFGNETYGRYNEFHVRKGIWQSLLSGAKAGFMYGSHGVWGWYKRGKEFLNESFGAKAYPWQIALSFKGAWEASFAKWIYENYDMFDIEPCYDGILNENIQQKNEIRMSASADKSKVFIYIPYSADVKVGMELDGYDCTLINLTDKIFAKPVVKPSNGSTLIPMHDFNSDALLIALKK